MRLFRLAGLLSWLLPALGYAQVVGLCRPGVNCQANTITLTAPSGNSVAIPAGTLIDLNSGTDTDTLSDSGGTATFSQALSVGGIFTVGAGRFQVAATSGLVTKYDNISTQAAGVPFIVLAPALATGLTTAQASFGTFTTPNDGNKHVYMVTAWMKVTAFTSGTISAQVTFTDEGASSMTTTIQLNQVGNAGFSSTAGAVADYAGVPSTIVCNPNTTVTLKTAGAFTLTYDLYMSVLEVL